MTEYSETQLLACVQDSRTSLPDAIWIATYTDKLTSGLLNEKSDNDLLKDSAHLLELRIFNENRELLCRRDYMGESFYVRILDDSCGLTPFDEVHFLDQDTTQTVSKDEKRTTFKTMSGGTYTLPVKCNVNKVIVRTYFKSNPNNGIEYPVDWRVKELC